MKLDQEIQNLTTTYYQEIQILQCHYQDLQDQPTYLLLLYLQDLRNLRVHQDLRLIQWIAN